MPNAYTEKLKKKSTGDYIYPATMGAGQHQTAWAYVETETECTVQLRGYGYTSNTYTTAGGQLVAIPVTGIFQ